MNNTKSVTYDQNINQLNDEKNIVDAIIDNITDNTTDNAVDNTIENNPKRRFTKNKKKLFISQRNAILQNIFNIIGVSNINKSFYSSHIDDNEEIANQIYALEDDIIKYFNISSWPAFKKNSKLTDKKALSIVKSVMKDMNVEYVSACVRIKDANLNTKYATLYNITTNI